MIIAGELNWTTRHRRHSCTDGVRGSYVEPELKLELGFGCGWEVRHLSGYTTTLQLTGRTETVEGEVRERQDKTRQGHE